VVAIAPPALASADVSPAVTGQALAADAVFLDYAPAPPGGAGALCLVDTGVHHLPDTAGVVSAIATDGGTGDDVDPMGHGTIDAAIAGGVGHGVLGAWPQLRIVSVRSTDVPPPGKEPTFAFNDYIRGIQTCLQPVAGVHVLAIDLPLSSVIPPTPDQTTKFAAAVAAATARGVNMLAAAGNAAGAIELPASEPGIFAVGGDQAPSVDVPSANGLCADQATVGLTFFAPGCGIDEINAVTDAPLCCGYGTSQASAYAAGVIVALRSYDPALTPDKAAQLLLSSTAGGTGHLDVAAAFRADNLGSIVDAGTAAIPKPSAALAPPPPVSPPPASSPSPPAGGSVPAPAVKRASWRRGVLRVSLRILPKNARLHAKIAFAHGRPLYVVTHTSTFHRRTKRPRLVILSLSEGAASGATVTVHV
jgi:hypothetical protein